MVIAPPSGQVHRKAVAMGNREFGTWWSGDPIPYLSMTEIRARERRDREMANSTHATRIGKLESDMAEILAILRGTQATPSTGEVVAKKSVAVVGTKTAPLYIASPKLACHTPTCARFGGKPFTANGAIAHRANQGHDVH